MDSRFGRREIARPTAPREEYAVILDFLPNGYPLASSQFRNRPIAQAIGTKYYTLLEISPKKDVTVSLGEKVYIGPDERPKVEVIVGRMPYDKLTATARSELDHVLKDMIQLDEPKFIDFFNRAGPLSMRMHSIELIPGIGKKVMWDIVNGRDDKPFESFVEMYSRIQHLPELNSAMVKRIIDELQGKDKHKLFTK
jgi:putative nucleotide binding protein